MPTYPGIYRAKASKLEGTKLTAFIPQVFGDVPVTIESFVGSVPTGLTMGWVSFQGGSPEFPVWHGGGTGTGTGSVSDVLWVDPNAPTDDLELWWDTDEPEIAIGFATNAETITGTVTDKAVSPASLAAKFNATTLGFHGVTPVVRATVPAAATDPATTMALVNALRTALINLGLIS